jgi:hypothetical protein
MSDGMKVDKKVTSRKWIAVVAWWIIMVILLTTQVILSLSYIDIRLPIFEAVVISGSITGGYFGFNILEKWVQK